MAAKKAVKRVSVPVDEILEKVDSLVIVQEELRKLNAMAYMYGQEKLSQKLQNLESLLWCVARDLKDRTVIKKSPK